MTPSVLFVVANLRMGGQVSSVLSLAEALAERGIRAELLRPRGLDAVSKDALTRYGARGAVGRIAGALALLGGLGARARDPGAVLHLVLPSPAFASLARLAAFPPARTIVQYEGPALALDGETWRALRDDPILVAPRLVLGHRRWGFAARRLDVAHLATHPVIAAQLERLGARRIHVVPNLARLDGAPAAAAPRPDASSLRIGYVGHCHPVKGVDDLVAAFERAQARRPELTLALALSGDGDAARLRRRVAQSPARARIELLGLVPVRETLAALDALVLPFRSALTTTLYPSLLLEAHAARCPLVVSDLPELAPVLDRRSPALQVVPPRDVAALAGALEQLPRRADVAWAPYLRLPAEAEIVDRMVALYGSLAARD